MALDLQSIESKSAKACLLELYEDLLLRVHHNKLECRGKVHLFQ